MKVYDAVANAFVKEEATTIFGLLGDGQLTWWASMARHPEVRLIDAREEGSGLAMAEGYARASGKVGVCSVTHGPGLARLSLSLIAAARSRTPIVVHTATTKFNDERETQYLNQDRFVTAAECGYIEVMKPDFAEEAVRQAFYRARIESRPIVLSIPMDIVGKECDSDGEDYLPSAALFGGQQKIRPAHDRVQEAVRIISESKRPVIVLGRGAKDPQALEAADRLGKRIGALIATLKNVDAAFHLVGIIAETRTETFKRTVISGTENIIKAARQNNLKKIIAHFNLNNKDQLYSEVGMGFIELGDLSEILGRKSENKLVKYWNITFGGKKKVEKTALEEEVIEVEKKENPKHKIDKKKPFILKESQDKKTYSLAKCCNPIPGDRRR